ncbi:hypothetical protein GIB67_004498 [Kingdonia uniflora]|uniref:Cystinosin n=1 Tax=Kingdonia uniflora TaxID=39325 RepID=A0A7J7MS13_9MAGN|nr:hypothetical protein GIB67_004498 [Kingdonia uniflora]
MIPSLLIYVPFQRMLVLLTALTYTKFLLTRLLIPSIITRNSKVSKICTAISACVWISAAVCVIVACPRHTWLWLINVFSTFQIIMTVIKYIPQAFMNFRRKSTEGWSIGNILLDLTGGVTNYAQMAMQSIDQGSWVNFYGNIGKALLSLVSIFFDLLFMFQHYVLYRSKGKKASSDVDRANKGPLVSSSDKSSLESV